jgi:dTDP-4-amino-4,6-dideoxygalactose transaminase
MSKNFLQFSAPDISEDEILEVADSMRSGWVTTGPKTKRFEHDFANFMGEGIEVVSVNSATAGLHLGLEALGIGPGDQVITTTHTFTATAEIIRYLGADPVFVDIDVNTLCIDVDAAISAINSKTKAIIPVHFAGLSVDMTKLLNATKKNGVKIIEDAAHALPTSHNEKLIGTLDSDVTVFSFYANKTMTTGEGGMLVTKNQDIANRARNMRLHGISRDAFDRFTSQTPSWYYEVIAPGYKYNMTDIAASLGIHQLKKLYNFQVKRAAIADYYYSRLSALPLTLPPRPSTGDIHSWHLFVIQLNDAISEKRNLFIEYMYKQGVGCSVHYIPLHQQPYWKSEYRLTSDIFPVSQSVYERSVSIPIYSRMTLEDADRVVLAIENSLKALGYKS